MRISQSMLFNNFVTNMNSSSYKLMELNKQASSQKRINRPSDDPIGTSRVLSYRDSISSLEQYKSNVDTAKGWLGLADETLMQVNNVLIRAKEVAEQAATGTISADQREILSYEARQLMDQMINLSNARYEKKSIFGGHKVDGSAFEPAMNLSSNKDLPDNYTIEGKATGTVLVQFTGSGSDTIASEPDFRFSTDGGKNWTNGTATDIGNNEYRLDLNGISVTVPDDYQVSPSSDFNDTSGTWLWVRPTAKYKGDDQDENKVSLYAGSINSADVSVAGVFDKDVTVRLDDVEGNADGDTVTYSYSLDGGSNWNTGNTTTVDASENARFLVPGGRVEISGVAAGDYNENDQILIRPNRAAINVEISANEKIQINNIGKDVFGGIYKKPGDEHYTPGIEGAGNVFETLGELIGYLETNNQSGIQKSLENIDESLKQVNNQLASVGSRQNRLNISETVLSGLVLNENERLSKVEDIDVADLMTKLANQQIIYEAVLRSSSTIMRMSLVNHI